MISLIGKLIEITDSTNKTLVGVKGTVIKETKFSFVIQTQNGDKTVLKSAITLNVQGNIIDAKQLMQKPQDRYKLKWKQK